jgi:predicted nicotinamide N-methyase
MPGRLQRFSFNAIKVQLWLPALAQPGAANAQQAAVPGAFQYWAKLWPSAIALSRYIAEHPDYIAGKQVVELAAGLGLPGIVAAHMAESVIISDYMPEAIAMARSTAALNGLSNVRCRLLDWKRLPADLAAEVLLLSDVNYEPADFEELFNVLTAFLRKGATILLSTPQRLMAKSFIGSLLPYCIAQDEQEIPGSPAGTFVSVFVLRDRRASSPK